MNQVVHYHITTSLFDIVVSITVVCTKRTRSTIIREKQSNVQDGIRFVVIYSSFVGNRDYTDFISSDGSDLQVYGVAAVLCDAPFGPLGYCSRKCNSFVNGSNMVNTGATVYGTL